jgi:hypothetical protein
MASLSEPQIAELTAFASELADAARAEIMPYWRKRGLAVEDKMEPGRPAPESPVTVADRNAEAAMRKLIQARYPSHGVLGEEFGLERVDAELCWVLDPIDGTKSFITGERNAIMSRPGRRGLFPVLQTEPVRVHREWQHLRVPPGASGLAVGITPRPGSSSLPVGCSFHGWLHLRQFSF